MSTVQEVLERSRALGFLGPGPIDAHIVHARGFAAAAGSQPVSFVDLGSGGGVPGLVLAELWPRAHAVLLDSMERRTSFLSEVVGELGWGGRVTVVRERAEVFGRAPERRAAFDLVVARGFGPPSVTAECAAPLLRLGGRLVVSEPPEDDPGRWPAGPLSELGLRSLGLVEDGARFQVLEQVECCSDAYPRRVGLPAKRPLWLCST